MAKIRSIKGIQAVTVPGTSGQFDVIADGKIIFSKKTEGRFPEEDEILKAL